MCNVCGCSEGDVRIEGDTHDHTHGHHHTHDESTMHFGNGKAGLHVPGLSQTEIVEIEKTFFQKMIIMPCTTDIILRVITYWH